MSINVTGTAIFRKELEDGEYEDYTLSPEEIDIDTDVHDPNRQMGAELVHTITGQVEGNDIQMEVYEYAGNIDDDVNLTESGELELIENFTFTIADENPEYDDE